jgi:hypothetical protein
LTRAVGLQITKADLAALRSLAAASLRHSDLASAPSMAELVEQAGPVMRGAVARELASRCIAAGGTLERQVTGGRLPDPHLPTLGVEDWQALIVENWRILPIARRRTITEFLLARLQAKRPGMDAADGHAAQLPAAIAA